MPQRFPGFSCNSHGCRRNTSVEHDRTCDALGPPPAITTCIAGAARSFGTPLVQGHLRRNLVEALGGSDGSRLFLLLKTLDSNKFVKQGQPGAVIFKQHVGEASVGGLLATCLCHALEPPTTPITDNPAVYMCFTLNTAGFDFRGWLPGWARPWCSTAAAATLPAMTRCQATAPRHPTASRRRARPLGASFGWLHAYATQGSNSGPAEPSTQTARHACFCLALHRARRTSRRHQITREVVARAFGVTVAAGTRSDC